MDLKEFGDLTTTEIVKQLDAWEGGSDPEGFDEFAIDFCDRVIFPFKADSEMEKWTDRFLAVAGVTGMPMIRAMVLGYVRAFTDFKPLQALIAKLPEDSDE